jgi:multidrug efflux pump subunit AcrB
LLAAYKGTREVGFAVVATTMVLVMVFLPISFMDGMVGLLFTEFSVLLAMSVIFSSLIALTLTPVLASKLLKTESQKNWFNKKTEAVFQALERFYRRVLVSAMKLRLVAPLIIIGCIAGSYVLMLVVPSSLAPSEDKGVLFAFVKGADATSYNRMNLNMDIVETRLLPLVGQGVLKSFSTQAPAFGCNVGDETGFVIMILEDWGKRTSSINEALALINKTLANIPDVRVRAMMPGFRGGSSDPVKFVLGGSDYTELQKYAEVLHVKAEEAGYLTGGDTDYSEKTPELVVTMNAELGAALGISVSDISEMLELMLGGVIQTAYIDRGEEYDVYLRGDENNFNNASDLSQIYMRSSKGDLISLDTIATVEEVASASKLSHDNKQKSVTLSGSVAEGYKLGEVLHYLDELAIAELPEDISISYSGDSKDFKENNSSLLMVFGLALLVAYLVLAAQFESFTNPLVVMFTMPMGVLGGFIGLYLMNQGLNIYSQIGMIMLIGMVTKNGILIVEFANQLRDQ